LPSLDGLDNADDEDLPSPAKKKPDRLTRLLKTNVERHPEGLGDTLQLLQRDILLAARHGIEVGALHPYPICKFSFSDAFFSAWLSSSRFWFLSSLFQIFFLQG